VNSPLLIFCHVVYVSFIRRRGSFDLKEKIVKEGKDDIAVKFPPEKLQNRRTDRSVQDRKKRLCGGR